jgi:hypothetical protein
LRAWCSPRSTITVTNIGFSGAGDVFGAPQITMSTGGSISLMPLRDGANAAAANVGWQMSPGDPPIEIKAEAGIEAIASSGFAATVSVYEELLSLGGAPGVST